MNKNSILYIIAVIFSSFILNVYSSNDYYIISIRRNSKDIEYDKANEKDQAAIDVLVNDRMNDIYDIISDKKETYKTEDGKMDNKLEELNEISQLRKRNEGDKKIKFQFINRNRAKRRNTFKLNSVLDNENEEFDYIPFDSNLVIHICPVLNYYVVIAYLSDDIVNEIKKLPNVIRCTKSHKLEPSHSIDYDINSSNKTYNKEEILNETHWKELSVQERKPYHDFIQSQLSIISQGKYEETSNKYYDNNYYYPSSAGKGINIYVVDVGIDMTGYEDNFDTYEGTSDERIVRCEGMFSDGKYNKPDNEKICLFKDREYYYHGTYVSISALGTINGVAKKANLHLLAVDSLDHSILSALDYIKMNGEPNKTVVNISMACPPSETCQEQEIEDKVSELVERGIIVVVSSGNYSSNRCDSKVFSGCKGVISVGAINNENSETIEGMYEIASYSDYGECVDIFAPGTIRVTDKDTNEILIEKSGTSFSSPIVAGVVATIMSENPDIEYNYELMKKTLIDMSLKDVIKGLEGLNTPNRLLNNGKRSVYLKNKCNDPSGKYKCENECCSEYGFCVDPEKESTGMQSYCIAKNGCLSEYGICMDNKCGKDYHMRKCLKDECCSKNGECINIFDDKEHYCIIENECLSEFSSQCLSGDLENIDDYDWEYKEIIYDYNCKKELEPYENICNFGYYLQEGKLFDENKREQICNNYHSVCKELFEEPRDFVPSCYESYDSREKFENQYGDESEMTSKFKLFCSKRESSDEYCVSSNELFENITEIDVESFADDYECTNSLFKIYKNNCEKELISYKRKCYFISNLDKYPSDDNNRQELCNNYADLKCKNIYESGNTLLPNCEKIEHLGENYKNYRDSYIFFEDDLNLLEHDLFCGRENSESLKDDFCINDENISIRYGDIKLNNIDEIVEKVCHSSHCNEAILPYLKARYESLRREKEEFEDDFSENEKLEMFEKGVDYLTSEECNQ